MLKKYLLLSVAICLHINSVKCSLTTEYYENLISQRTAEAQIYEMPENNAEFKSGAEADEIHEFGSYDFIIVGAGSAGSVLATRLSEVEDWNILLLEAGDEEDDFNVIPSMFMYLQFSKMNWGYFTTPQQNCCLGMVDKKCMAPRGKALGGSSAINAVLYVRGNAKDYDKWVELGNPGWSYEDVLPYFIKSENSQIKGDLGYHGKGGLWDVEHSLPFTDLFSNFVDANDELNQTTVDYNGLEQFGISKMQLNIKHGKRQSAATAFLDNARKRDNLKIISKALVTKININKDTKMAEGVEFVTDNQKFIAKADNEVIISGGAINSPQLLMLSGIGPKEHLEEIGIEVIEDLPVGENLQEHPQFLGLTFRTNYTTPTYSFEELIEWYLNGLGPLTSTADAVGFIHTGNTSNDVPMIKYMLSPPPGSNSAPIVDRVYNFNDELTNNYLAKLNGSTDITFNLILLHQKSRGRITLKSQDPIDFPNIDLNLFSKSEDIDNFIEGIDFILKLTQTEAFRKINATFVDIPICNDVENSKLFWECAIRHMSMTLYHPCGTTAMGPDKTNSVVDSNLKVHGIEKLRVVDAGIFPSTISGPTNAPVVMVAEKTSDIIKNEYNKLLFFPSRN